MAWSTFHCDEPDFFVRSIREDPPVRFGVNRKALSDSDIFRDMFECCEAGFAMTMVDEAEQSLDLDEPADVLNVLLSLLHTPPHPPQKVPKLPEQKYSLIIYPPVFEYGTVIPFPLIPRMLQLADKYALSESTSQSLLAHLAAHVSSYPLEVYGFATERGLDKLAVDASKHLLHPPLSAYSPEQIRVVPTPEAWHKLVILHDGRIRGLRKILHQEEIFPHGYGACSLHQNRTLSLWNQRKMEILHKIEAASDVAAAMADLEVELSSCRTCHKACSAAVKMIEYKCARLPKSIKNIEDTETGTTWLSKVMEVYAR